MHRARWSRACLQSRTGGVRFPSGVPVQRLDGRAPGPYPGRLGFDSPRCDDIEVGARGGRLVSDTSSAGFNSQDLDQCRTDHLAVRPPLQGGRVGSDSLVLHDIPR